VFLQDPSYTRSLHVRSYYHFVIFEGLEQTQSNESEPIFVRMSSNKAKILLYDNDDYLKVMLERENCPSYRCNDYISYTCNSKCSYDGYVEAWRRRVAEWSFSVMDYYCLQRETASIALTFMDRYLSSIPKERMMSNYRLISICCLLIATKINEREFLSMSDINAISENKFMLKDIESMELSILKRLDWRLYPATSSLFVHLFSPFINGIPAEVMAKLLDLMNYICELASCGK